jgi:hypothetical protein
VPEFIPRTVTLKAPSPGPCPLTSPFVPFVPFAIEGVIFHSSKRDFQCVRGVLEYKCFSKRVTALLQTIPGEDLRGIATGPALGPLWHPAPEHGPRDPMTEGKSLERSVWVIHGLWQPRVSFPGHFRDLYPTTQRKIKGNNGAEQRRSSTSDFGSLRQGGHQLETRQSSSPVRCYKSNMHTFLLQSPADIWKRI